MEIGLKHMEDMAKMKYIDEKQKGPQDRTLGNTSSDWKWPGFERFELDKLPKRYDLNQSRGVSVMPMEASMSRRIL